ncbi:MAG TPA: hypothetical protein VGT79_06775 [Xanthomonadaceae bacterium]|nr:hypothetical protein [Xanthomonadaceae bacterium]
MTQPPLPPQMPPEPLDESERDLARALRNLPVGAPPPELDARILGAARRAVHLAQPRKRDRRWLVGFGTAASALLAIGLFVKTHGPGQDAVYTRPASESPAPASVSNNEPAAAAAPSATMKERAEPQAAADAMAPAGNAESAQSGMPAEAPAPQQESGQAQKTIGNLQGVAAKPAPQAFPSTVARESIAAPRPPPPPPRVRYAPAPIPPVVSEESAPMAAPAPPASPPAPMQPADERQEHKAEQDAAGRRDAAAAAVPAPTPQATGGAALDQPALSKTTSNGLKSKAAVSGEISSDSVNATEASKDKTLDSVEVVGGRIKRAGDDKGAVLPPIDDDARLSPTRWIERIRARVNAADGDGARESLRRFHAHYPDARIPADLQPLLH